MLPVFQPPPAPPPERREPAPPRRTYFLHVRGRNRGAEVEALGKVAGDRVRVRVRVLNTGEVLVVRRKVVQAVAPAPDARVVGGGLPTLGERRRS